MYGSYVRDRQSTSKARNLQPNRSMPATKIICQLCSEVYKKPKLLPCFHTFCETCLYNYIGKHSKNEQFACPCCSKNILVPNNIATDFKASHFVLAYMEQNPNQSDVEFESCDVCGKREDCGYSCQECDQQICQSCNAVHASIKSTKRHKVTRIKGAPRTLHIQRTCSEHNEDLRFYCRTCQEGICVDCKLEDHEGHITDRVEEAKLQGRQTIESVETELVSHLRDLKCEKEALDYRKRLVDKSFQETRSYIQKQAEEICRIVSVIRDMKLVEAEKMRDEQQQAINKIESEIKIWESQIETVADYLHFVNSSTSDVDVLEACDMVQETVQSVKNFVCPSLDVQCIELEMENSIRSKLEELFGKIAQYPALRMRLEYGSTSSFECGSQKEAVDAICVTGSDSAWIASHVGKKEKSSLSLFSKNGDILKTVQCEQIIKCLAILDGMLHVLTKKSFLKLNENTDLEMVVSPVVPVLLASNTTSMFYLSPDYSCYYVTRTDVKPIEDTFLCSLSDLQNPTKMAIDDSENIVVLDADLKCVRIFDLNGVPKNQNSFEYTNFLPLDVCIDKWSDILVVDGGNEAIHELSSESQGREIMYSRFSGLRNICCIAGNEDCLWFGSKDGIVFVKHL